MRKFNILCQTDEELSLVLKKMEKDNCEWLSGHKPTYYTGYWGTPVWLHVDDKGKIGLSTSMRDPVVSVEEYLKEEKKEMTLKDLKPGMVVEYNNEKRRLVVPCGEQNSLVLIGEHGSNSLETFDDCLKSTVSTLCINKIYKPIRQQEFSDYLKTSNLILIWERKPEPKEMTMQQLEELLGYPVKIVKETK